VKSDELSLLLQLDRCGRPALDATVRHAFDVQVPLFIIGDAGYALRDLRPSGSDAHVDVGVAAFHVAALHVLRQNA
jgi:hypothetical protein